MNIWLFVIIQAVGSAILGFIGIVGVLSMGIVSATSIIWCFAIGFVLSIPAAWIITRRIS